MPVVLTALAGTTALAGHPAHAAKRPKPRVQLTAGALAVERTGSDPAALPDDVRDKVMAALRAYIRAATVRPLQKGQVDDAAMNSVVGPAVTARLSGPDRSVLVDEGIGRATRRIVVKGLPVAITGLADGQGRVVVAVATLDTVATTRTAKGKVAIRRMGELVLSPDADAWKITGYTLQVDRVGKGVPTTAPAAPPPPAPDPGAPAQ